MPSFLTSVVQILNAAGARVDQLVRNHYQPIVLKLSTGLTATSRDRGDGLTEVTVTTDAAAGGTATAIKTTGADVVVSGAAPPTTGQALIATSATTAAWVSLLQLGSSSLGLVSDAAGYVGVATTAARSDHTHRMLLENATYLNALDSTGLIEIPLIGVNASDRILVGDGAHNVTVDAGAGDLTLTADITYLSSGLKPTTGSIRIGVGKTMYWRSSTGAAVHGFSVGGVGVDIVGMGDPSWPSEIDGSELRTLLTPTSETGADATGTVKVIDLAPRRIKTTDNGTHDYLFDIGADTLPANCDANVLVDFTVHLYGVSSTKVPHGCWKVSATWSRSLGANLILTAADTGDDIGDASVPTLTPGSDSTNDHVVKFSIAAPTNATYHWVITARVEATYFAGVS